MSLVDCFILLSIIIITQAGKFVDAYVTCSILFSMAFVARVSWGDYKSK